MAKIDGPKPQFPALSPKLMGPLTPTTAPTPAGPVPLPMPNVANVGDTGFSQAAKKLVSITGRQKAGSPGITLDNEGLAGNVFSVKSGVVAGPATKAPKLHTPQSVADLVNKGVAMKRPDKSEVDEGEVNAQARNYKDAQKALAATPPKYADAAAALGKVAKDEMVADAVLGTRGLRQTETVRDQTAFLGKMQAAGVNPVSYPPTQDQLLQYFGSKGIKDHPDAARQALGEYAKAFHEHPAKVPGAKADVVYSKDGVVTKKNTDVTTSVPETWDEVLKRPVGKADPKDSTTKVAPNGESIAKQVNDCEGFAFMAEQLMKQAGFDVKHHVTLNKTPPPKPDQHAMVVFTHPNEKGKVTVTSNDGVFVEKTESEALKKGWKHANGGKATGKEKYYEGKTMQDSQVNAVVVDAKHTVKVK